MTDGTRAAALSPRGPLGRWVKPQEGGEGARTKGARAFWGHRSGPVGYPNFWMCDPAQRRTESSLSVAARTQLRMTRKARPWRRVSVLTWASRAGLGAGGGCRRGRHRAPAPHGLAPGPPGRRARPRTSALCAQRAGALSPPGQRGCSRAAGWRGRTPGSAVCGTRRGSAAPASGPRPWVAPWDAETPCCAAGRAGPGLGSCAPGGREGAGPGGTRAPGRRWPSGGKGQGAGEGSCLKGGRSRDPGERHQQGRKAAQRG